MIIKFSLLFALSFLAVTPSFAQSGLTPVKREPCVSFPKVTPANQMVKGLHYEEKSYCYGDDSDGRCDDYRFYNAFRHFYFVKTVTDYYTADGKLITSKVNSQKYSLTATGDTASIGEKNLVTEIQKKIFKSDYPVCDDSFYK